MRFIAFLVFGFLGLSILYLMVSVYSRSVRRERLEDQWAENNPGGDLSGRDAYIEQGMANYERGFRKKLIALVYVVPIIAVATIFYLTN
jgi:hypothetical protein